MNPESRRLRVLYIVPDLAIGGAERHVVTLMPALDRSRFEPTVICIGAEGALFESLADDNVPAIALNRTKRQSLAALRDLVREIRRVAPDVIIVRGYIAEVLGRLAGCIAGVPTLIVWVHNHGDTVPRSKVRIIADRVLDRFTAAYFGVAHAQRAYLVEELGYPNEKITILPNGVDYSLFSTTDDRAAVHDLGISDEDAVVGILAAMRPEKDHALLLDAAVLVFNAVPTAKFLLVGDGQMRADLETRVRDLGIADRVIFAGSRSDVPAVLSAIDVFVLSSYSVECFPMALLEAMAAGRPAVCTDVGGVGEMIVEGQTGFLVKPRDAAAMSERIIEVLLSPGLRRRMGTAARHRVESHFSLSASVSATESALERLARPPAPDRVKPAVLTVVLDLTFVGGVELLILELFRHLDPTVVRPRIVCLREAGPLAEDFRSAGFEVVVLTRSGRLGLNRLSGLVRDLDSSGTDVVLVPHHHRAALLLGRLAARRAGIASIVAAHDMDLTSTGGRVLPRWAVASLGLSDALVLLTAAQGDYLRREEGVGRALSSTTREVVIPNGIVLPARPGRAERERARDLLRVDQETFVVGIVARLSAQKAHEVMFAAIAQLAQIHPSTRFFVIGGGEREHELRAFAIELGIDSITSFLGVRRDVGRLLPGLDASCLSSTHEGVPMTIIESMAARIPVVATDCGSLRDMVTDGENGYLVPVGDVDAFAERLSTLAADPALRRRLGDRGRDRVEKEFRIAETARRYEQLVIELASKRGVD